MKPITSFGSWAAVLNLPSFKTSSTTRWSAGPKRPCQFNLIVMRVNRTKQYTQSRKRPDFAFDKLKSTSALEKYCGKFDFKDDISWSDAFVAMA